MNGRAAISKPAKMGPYFAANGGTKPQSPETGRPMQRRTFISAFAASLAVSNLTRAQQRQKLALIGFLDPIPPSSGLLAFFREGLRGQGFVEGENVRVAYRSADGHYARLPALAAELVQLGPAVIVAAGGPISARAVQNATKTIPIVGTAAGYQAKSFNRPIDNLTGASTQTGALNPKRLQLLHEIVPGAARVAVLINPDSPFAPNLMPELAAAARALGIFLVRVEARRPAEFASAFAAMAEQRAQALLVLGDPLFFAQRGAIIALALRYKLPAIYEWGEIAQDGGLMAYGDSLKALFRRMGDYAGRILKGANPGDLPIDQPAAIRLVINSKTAKALGLTIPPLLLIQADELIE
jgi:putative tryptophan/tyrosine transport system substrate-binding protein